METPVRSTPGSLRILARLFGNYMAGEWRRVALGFFLLLAASGTALLQPWPLKMILDGVVGDAPAHPWVAAATSTVGGWIGRPNEPKVLLLLLCGCLLLIHAISGALKVLHTYVLVSAGLRMIPSPVRHFPSPAAPLSGVPQHGICGRLPLPGDLGHG
jgi:hypothetical protein